MMGLSFRPELRSMRSPTSALLICVLCGGTGGPGRPNGIPGGAFFDTDSGRWILAEEHARNTPEWSVKQYFWSKDGTLDFVSYSDKHGIRMQHFYPDGEPREPIHPDLVPPALADKAPIRPSGSRRPQYGSGGSMWKEGGYGSARKATGVWRLWNSNGELVGTYLFKNGKVAKIVGPMKGR